MIDFISELLRLFHYWVFWHKPVDGTCSFWCATCGKKWKRFESYPREIRKYDKRSIMDE